MKYLFSLLLPLLCACGYHSGSGELLSSYSTIAVPYVEGDEHGELTAALIRELSTEGSLRYSYGAADLLLRIDLEKAANRNIGFRFERNKHGKLSDHLIQSEGRLALRAHVQLIEGESGELLREEAVIEASLDYDHDYYSTRDETNVLSLGQVTEIEEAQEEALSVLYSQLARQIVEYLYALW